MAGLAGSLNAVYKVLTPCCFRILPKCMVQGMKKAAVPWVGSFMQGLRFYRRMALQLAFIAVWGVVVPTTMPRMVYSCNGSTISFEQGSFGGSARLSFQLVMASWAIIGGRASACRKRLKLVFDGPRVSVGHARENLSLLHRASMDYFADCDMKSVSCLRLRGAGPKKKKNTPDEFPPGSLPDWAEKIVEYRNKTPPVQRVRSKLGPFDRACIFEKRGTAVLRRVRRK